VRSLSAAILGEVAHGVAADVGREAGFGQERFTFYGDEYVQATRGPPLHPSGREVLRTQATPIPVQ